MADSGRCVPCDDGRRLLIAAAVARLGWALATRRLAPDSQDAPLSTWMGLAVSSVAPVLAYRLAVNLRLPRGAALAAGVLLAIHPALVEAGTRGEVVAALPFLAAAGLVAWVYAWQSGKIRAAVLSGLLGGAAVLAGAAAWPAAAALAAVALWRRKEQPRWKSLLAAALVFGALAAAPGAERFRPAPREPFTKWSAPLAVTPAASSATRGIRGLFAAVLLVGALLGLRAVASGPGGWFALAWLAAVAAGSAWSGAGPFPFEDPVLAVLAGAGLTALAGLSG